MERMWILTLMRRKMMRKSQTPRFHKMFDVAGPASLVSFLYSVTKLTGLQFVLAVDGAASPDLHQDHQSRKRMMMRTQRDLLPDLSHLPDLQDLSSTVLAFVCQQP